MADTPTPWTQVRAEAFPLTAFTEVYDIRERKSTFPAGNDGVAISLRISVSNAKHDCWNAFASVGIGTGSFSSTSTVRVKCDAETAEDAGRKIAEVLQTCIQGYLGDSPPKHSAWRKVEKALSEGEKTLEEIKDIFDLLFCANPSKGDVVSKDDVKTQDVSLATTTHGFVNYPALFPVARSMKRHFVFHAGPTNSGKTYGAMKELKWADAGVYLAPLRLMAMEAYDKLKSAGIPANMKTGEERILEDGARHTASTIEMLNTSEIIDIAIIDEVQMIKDEDRGWAWTQAIVGVPAKKIIMTGSPEVKEYIQALIESIGDTFEYVEFTRLNELHVMQGNASASDLKPGDAVIAFSRKRVLELHEEFSHRGLKVACIYGALSPETRRREAERFASGEVDIIVATDAIGMGLNLPAKRVLFSTMKKYDGDEFRTLNGYEIRQIAGRAGRYGLHDGGLAGLYNDFSRFSVTREDKQTLVHALQKNIYKDVYKCDFYPVMPTGEMVKIVSDAYGETLTPALESCERIFNETAPVNGIAYRFVLSPSQSNMSKHIQKHMVMQEIDVQYGYMGCPVRLKDEPTVAFLIDCLRGHDQASTIDMPTPNMRNVSKIDLKFAEAVSAVATMYMWLSLKFPDTYPDHATARIGHEIADNVVEWHIREKYKKQKEERKNKKAKKAKFKFNEKRRGRKQ